MKTKMALIWSATLVVLGAFAAAQTEHPAANFGHETFQPAYADGRLVQFEQRGPSDEDIDRSKVNTLYEVEYPAGWQELLARPLCAYCDHGGDGENAWDYHDHVLDALPEAAANDAGEVYWHVLHVLPAYTEDEAVNAEVTTAYAELLPAQSGDDVRALLAATLTDGTPVAELVDTAYIFTAPLVRR